MFAAMAPLSFDRRTTFVGFVRSGDAFLMSTVPRSGSRARQPGATNLSARFAFTYTWGACGWGACGRFGISRLSRDGPAVKGPGGPDPSGPPGESGKRGRRSPTDQGRGSPSQARNSIRSPPEAGSPAGGGRCALELLDIGGDPHQQLSDAADVDVDVAAAKRLILSWLISHQPRLASISTPPMTTSGSTWRS